jgi:hypothetical protein
MEPQSKSLRTRFARPGAGALLLVLGLAGCGSAETASRPARGAQPPATFAETVTIEPISGKVVFRVPATGGGGAGQFALLSSARRVPVGTVVNATAGKVRLTVATPPPTRLRTGEFHAGSFQIDQPRADGGLVLLRIRDKLSRRTACPTTSGTRSQRILGLLRGTASVGFQTVGRFSAATVRGTEWGVRDRCDGTFTVVQEGEVVVRDFRLRKNIVLRTGQTFLASAG